MDETLKLCGEAANWWVAKIAEEHKNIPSCKLEGIRKELKKAIKNTLSHDGSMRLSTYNHRDALIENILFSNGIETSFLPLGYEMIIILEHACVSDNAGHILVEF